MIALLASAAASRAAAADHLFVMTSDTPPNVGGGGSCAALELEDPWTASTDLEPVGTRTTVRHFAGLHWVVSYAPDDQVQVIDPATFETLRKFSVGAGSDPRDIAVVDANSAWVSRRDSRWLLKIHPLTGAPLDSVDLGGFSDADLLPEMGWMALDGAHLFIQLQRIDRIESGTTVPPALLAVVDVTTNALVDVDPAQAGVQAIELQGTEPKGKMQIEGRRLYVQAPGQLLGTPGGLEEIDLDTLTNEGYLISELDGWADIGGFLFVSPTRGYVINHTDFALSSHLDAFSRPDGAFLEELHVTFAMVNELAYDPLTDQIFFPDPQAGGVLIFRGATGDTLGGPIATGLPPGDLLVFRQGPPTGGTSSDIPKVQDLALRPNPFTKGTTIACRATAPGLASITVYDVAGRAVRRLIERRAVPAGETSFAWDGRDDSGRPVVGGVYVVRAEVGDRRAARLAHRIR